MNETSTTNLCVTIADKILFVIRGGTYLLKSSNISSKDHLRYLRKICLCGVQNISVDRNFYAHYNEKKGFFNSYATRNQTIRNLNREVK
jgi:hypothetical protein